MPSMEIEGFEKEQPVRVVAGSEGNGHLVGRTGVVSFCYESDYDGTPWVYVVVDGMKPESEDLKKLKRSLSRGAKTFAFRPDDLEAVGAEGEAEGVEVPAVPAVEGGAGGRLENPFG